MVSTIESKYVKEKSPEPLKKPPPRAAGLGRPQLKLNGQQKKAKA